MGPDDYRFSKEWAIKAELDSVSVGSIITVHTSSGSKKVRVTDVVTRATKSGKAYDLLFTTDVD